MYLMCNKQIGHSNYKAKQLMMRRKHLLQSINNVKDRSNGVMKMRINRSMQESRKIQFTIVMVAFLLFRYFFLQRYFFLSSGTSFCNWPSILEILALAKSGFSVESLFRLQSINSLNLSNLLDFWIRFNSTSLGILRDQFC